MKRLIALIIAVGMLLTAGAANVVWAKDGNSDKIICQATLDDSFSDDCVIVTIDKNHGGINKFFSKEKFKGVDLTSVCHIQSTIERAARCGSFINL